MLQPLLVPFSSLSSSLPSNVSPMPSKLDGLSLQSNFYKAPNHLEDAFIALGLDCSYLGLYHILYKAAYGFNRNWFRASLNDLRFSSGLSLNSLRKALSLFSSKGLLHIADTNSRGTLYFVVIPDAPPKPIRRPSSSPTPRSRRPGFPLAPSPQAPSPSSELLTEPSPHLSSPHQPPVPLPHSPPLSPPQRSSPGTPPDQNLNPQGDQSLIPYSTDTELQTDRETDNTHTPRVRATPLPLPSDIPRLQPRDIPSYDSPLTSLSPSALDGFYSSFPSLEVLRAVLSVAFSYHSLPSSVRNPAALLRSCLSRLHGWQPLSDIEIAHFAQTQAYYLKRHIKLDPGNVWNAVHRQEALDFCTWLDIHRDHASPAELWHTYERLCPSLRSDGGSLLWILAVPKV